MELSDKDIRFLTRTVKNCEEQAAKLEPGTARWVARAEAARLLINLAGWRWDYDKEQPYKVTTREKREYFNATTTN